MLQFTHSTFLLYFVARKLIEAFRVRECGQKSGLSVHTLVANSVRATSFEDRPEEIAKSCECLIGDLIVDDNPSQNRFPYL